MFCILANTRHPRRASAIFGLAGVLAVSAAVRGLTGIGIADLMKEADLTVDGFYKHFDSRGELVFGSVRDRPGFALGSRGSSKEMAKL
jgi:AcrR family transcriptional regulator